MKLYFLQLAMLQPINAPVPGYLIQTDDGKNILVDSGLPYSTIANPPELPGVRPIMRDEDFVVNRLATIGLRPADIDMLICTHFDADHAGNHHLFPQAELVVQRSHYEAALAGHPRSAPMRASWNSSALRYRLVDGDTTLVPGVELIESSGHVPGHQSVLVRLQKTGPVLLAIDAIPDSSMLDPDTREIHFLDLDEASVRASTRKLVQIARREQVALLFPGHDARMWPTLKRAPDFYE